jgi:hypothetical protein
VNYLREAVVVITQYIQPIQMELTYTVTWTQMVDIGQFVFYNSSIFFWFPPVVLGHTVCSIGPKYILHTVVGRLLNEFGYHTVFKNIFDSAI